MFVGYSFRRAQGPIGSKWGIAPQRISAHIIWDVTRRRFADGRNEEITVEVDWVQPPCCQSLASSNYVWIMLQVCISL